MNGNDYIKGYRNGFEDGKKEALIELQKQNTNTDLPSNQTLFKIFRLVIEKKEIDEKSCSCYINPWDGYCDYIVKNWDRK